MTTAEKWGLIEHRTREILHRLEMVYNPQYHDGDRVQATLDDVIHTLQFFLHWLGLAGRHESEPLVWPSLEERSQEVRSEWRGLPSELMPRSQLDTRGFSARIMTLPQMIRRDDIETDQWCDCWRGHGYSLDESRALRTAFSHIEMGWSRFYHGDPDRALWPLVDAVGLLTELFPTDSEQFTGRGYGISKGERFKSRPRWGIESKRRSAEAPIPFDWKRQSVDPPKIRPQEIKLDPRRAFSAMQKAEIFLRCNGHCIGCGVELEMDGGWHADHFMPWSWGGLTEVRNGQALCIPCNQRKRDHVLTVDGGE
jgi:hypothetical protein